MPAPTPMTQRVLAIAGLAGLLLTGCTSQDHQAPTSTSTGTPAASSSTTRSPEAAAGDPTTSSSSASHAPAGTAQAQLDALPVKGKAPKTGYDRDQFGQAWADVDRNGCDTRNDVLARDLTQVVYKPGTHDCKVATGQLVDPYNGWTIDFTAGKKTSTAVQIDHAVALSDAWQTGAQQLSAEDRTRLANDPLNLLAVDGPTNESKSDGDAATWLPPNKSYRCQYVARQVAVKSAYGLWVTPAEHEAIAGILQTCPGQQPITQATPTRIQATTTSPAPTTTPEKPAQTSAPGSTGAASGADGTTYSSCAAAKAAGTAPLHAGDPGYSRRLDRDGDGTACE